MSAIFEVPLRELQPTQLYISQPKLQSVKYALACGGAAALLPIPIAERNGRLILTDGHTRSLALYYRGDQKLKVCWEPEELDWEMYDLCLGWCAEAGVKTVVDLACRVVSHQDFERLWCLPCMQIAEALAQAPSIHRYSMLDLTDRPSP